MSILCGFAVTSNLSGCGKNEKIPTTADRLAAVQQKQETIPDFYVPRKTVDYMSDLKSLKDAPARNDRSDSAPASTRPEPAKPLGSPPPAQESKVATAPEPTPAPPTLQTAPTTSPATAPTSAPTIAPTATPTPNALTPSASAPSSNVFASAAPTARPAPKEELAPAVSVISREQPEFPRDALRAGIESGSVRARLTISASGEVTDVSILQAQPPRVFDRSVKTALGRWRFNAGSNGRTFDTDVGFKAAN
jgi:protein TonB